MSEFRPVNPDDRLLYELMPILIGIGPKGSLLCFGSCFIAWGHMAITAKHVVDELLRCDPGIAQGAPSKYEYWIIQVKWDGNGHDYVVWTIDSIAMSPHSDIAIIWLRGLNDVAAAYKEWKAVPVTFDPPQIGATVRAFGLHNVRFDGSRVNADGKFGHVEVNCDRSISSGIVRRHYWEGRDKGMYNFPCIEVDARFDHGMSGGLVIDEQSHVCGIVCGSLPALSAGEDHISYVAMLWPMMGIPVDPRLVPGGVETAHYRLQDLAVRGVFTPTGWDRVLIQDKGGTDGPIAIRYLRKH
jgi:hypothetical protein